MSALRLMACALGVALLLIGLGGLLYWGAAQLELSPAPELSAPTQPAPSTLPRPGTVPTLFITATSTPQLKSPTTTPLTAFKTVQLAWFYKPPTNRDLASLARSFSWFTLTHLDEPTRDALRARGVTQPFWQYVRFDAIHNPGTCTRQPYRNQVAFKPGDYCALLREHPDWFLRDARGAALERYDGAQYVMMDPAQAGWRAYWLQRAQQLQEAYAWDGIFLDNVEGSRDKLLRRGFKPLAYPDDASYQAAVEGFLKTIATNYARPQQRPVFANLIEVNDPAIWFRYLQYLDGAMDEAFAVDFQDGYLSVAEWEQDLQLAEQTQALDKQIILVSQGKRTDQARQQFALASYLLVNAGRAWFRYTDSQSYEEIWLYRNYELDLGAPLGVRYQAGPGWRRDFTKGSVFVDPAKHSATLTIY